MAISVVATVLLTALWPQGDIRDPLGIWGGRVPAVGDASGGEIKATMRVPAERGAANIFTCVAVTITQLEGALATDALMCRLLSNWPNVDELAGVQGFGTVRMANLINDASFTGTKGGPSRPLVAPQDRFILLFDPRPSAGDLDIVELKSGVNTLADTWSFEAYGYWWDRSVLNAPGGPRHPGGG